MAADDIDDTSTRRRRILHRRSGLAFSASTLGDSTTTEGGAEGDDEDEDADLNSQVVQQVLRPPDQVMRDDTPNPTSIANAEEYTPQARMEQVRARGGDYEKEYRLGLLHRMLMRNLPLDEIASALGVSVRQVQRYKQELATRLRETAKELDIELLIGDGKGFYEEVQALAMRTASSANTPVPMRLAALRTALASQNDKHRFFQAAGVYDVLRFRKGGGSGGSDIQKLMALTEELLSESRRSPNDGLTFSNNDDETLEL